MAMLVLLLPEQEAFSLEVSSFLSSLAGLLPVEKHPAHSRRSVRGRGRVYGS